MSKIDKLLSIKNELHTKETKTLEIRRLSEKIGEPYEITIGQIQSNDYRKIQQDITIVDKKGVSVNLPEFHQRILIKGVLEPNLTDAELLKGFGVNKAVELADLLFTVNEQQLIVNEILAISGLNMDEEDVSETVKKQ